MDAVQVFKMADQFSFLIGWQCYQLEDKRVLFGANVVTVLVNNGIFSGSLVYVFDRIRKLRFLLGKWENRICI